MFFFSYLEQYVDLQHTAQCTELVCGLTKFYKYAHPSSTPDQDVGQASARGLLQAPPGPSFHSLRDLCSDPSIQNGFAVPELDVSEPTVRGLCVWLFLLIVHSGRFVSIV